MRKARTDFKYHACLLAALAGAGAFSGNEVSDAYERTRLNPDKSYTKDQAEELAFHKEYHRVQDILGFFTILSVLVSDDQDPNKADPSVIEICHFFYDAWRAPLHGIVRDLGEYRIPQGKGAYTSSEVLRKRRYEGYFDVLKKLDIIFQLTDVEWRNDPLSQNHFAPTEASCVEKTTP